MNDTSGAHAIAGHRSGLDGISLVRGEPKMTGIDLKRLDELIAGSFFKTSLEGEVVRFGDGSYELRVSVKRAHRQFLGAVHGGIVGTPGYCCMASRAPYSAD